MFGLPEYYVLFTLFVLGLIIGSFLDVLVSRFHTGASLNGRSRCFSCGRNLRWFELVPVLSYITLRGRCRTCGARVPLRLLGMELLTGGLFLYAGLSTSDPALLLYDLILMAFLIVVAQYDLRHMIIPNSFVYTAFVLVLVWAGLHIQTLLHLEVALQHVAAGVLICAFYGSLWLFSKGRWIGLGDVKLSLPLSLFFTIEHAFTFLVFAFWIGAIVSLVLLGIQYLLYRGQHHLPFSSVPLTMKSEVPFAPFMIAAFVFVYFSGADILSVMAHMF